MIAVTSAPLRRLRVRSLVPESRPCSCNRNRTMNHQNNRIVASVVTLLLGSLLGGSLHAENKLTLNDREYLTTRGLDVLVFSNYYDGLFSDAKIAGIELIHHGERTVTNGDVRLSPTPGQWDPVPALLARSVDKQTGTITAKLGYASEQFEYSIRVTPQGAGAIIQVVLDRPLPRSLEGRAGLNLEFLPAAYFNKGFLIDDRSGALPLYPSGPTGRSSNGEAQRLPIAAGHKLTLAPEDAQRRVTVETHGGELGLFDGRNEAQNGWFVVRTLLPAGKTGTVVEWSLTASTLPQWTRPTVIGHSQVGYHTAQPKVAVLERDRNAPAPDKVRLLRVTSDGKATEVFAADATSWGEYLRYRYYTFDFSAVRDPGLYVLDADGVQTEAFRIADDVFATAWNPTLDVFLNVQMDHMFVRDAYRVWHGHSHMDDARQVPENKQHFDLYGEGPTNDSPFKPGEHVPGLNVGGWFDAGDFDLRTETHYAVVSSLVDTWERFRPQRDETTID